MTNTQIDSRTNTRESFVGKPVARISRGKSGRKSEDNRMWQAGADWINLA